MLRGSNASIFWNGRGALAEEIPHKDSVSLDDDNSAYLR